MPRLHLMVGRTGRWPSPLHLTAGRAGRSPPHPHLAAGRRLADAPPSPHGRPDRALAAAPVPRGRRTLTSPPADVSLTPHLHLTVGRTGRWPPHSHLTAAAPPPCRRPG